MLNSQETSIKAYLELINEHQLGARQQTVFHAIRKYGDMTNLEVSQRLGIPINQITPRCLELRQKGLLSSKGIKLQDNGKSAIVWGLVD